MNRAENKHIGTIDRKRFLNAAVLIVLCLLLNLLISFFARKYSYTYFPLYLDTIGTALAVMLGGILPGVIVAFATNALNSLFSSHLSIYFGAVNVIAALMIRYFYINGYFKKIYKIFYAALTTAFLCAVTSSLIEWGVYGSAIGDEPSSSFALLLNGMWKGGELFSLLAAEILINIVDKSIVIFAAVIIFTLCPARLKAWLGTVAPDENRKWGLKTLPVFFHSLLGHVVRDLVIFDLIICFIVSGICYYMYQDTNIKKYSTICQSATQMASDFIDPDLVDSFIAERSNIYDAYTERLPKDVLKSPADFPEFFEDFAAFAKERYSDEYLKTVEKLNSVMDAFGDLQYLYVYRIKSDGCHVVFDVDESAYEPVVQFDQSFMSLVPDLIRGKQIEPMITDDTYGWLLTFYNPVYDDSGKCVAYVCADISMHDLRKDQLIFIVKLISLMISTSSVILLIILNIFERSMVKPIKAISEAAADFAFDTEDGRKASAERIYNLNIVSCAEIEQQYESFEKLANDSIVYIDKIRSDTQMISMLQEGTLIDFADMVENRDKNTGDHIKKTSYYVKCIAEELRAEGIYTDMLTDDYIKTIVRSAPLHDIGKITVSDTILNKPGRLTDEEFKIMKNHTTAGRDILNNSTVNSLDRDYFREAINMAHYHHEWWNGKGYPTGISGENIPLSARIMAVADVFDALVSKRSYKEPFTFDDAIEIMKKESGTHFDPKIINAFLNIANGFKK